MPTYVIGDLQGCYDELQQLLELIQFNPDNDRLWFVGDLVNRGPQSVECLRFVKALGNTAITVLGNHDLSLLATAEGLRKTSRKDTLNCILKAPDRDELLHWLRKQPLIHYDAELNYSMVHAGLAPQWTIEQARELASEVSSLLRGDDYCLLLQNMYGDEPTLWSESLKGMDKYRFTINAFTRIRYCTTSGALELNTKDSPQNPKADLIPWFDLSWRESRNEKILFGHWSTLGCINQNNVYSLDSGCVWGGHLSALRIDKQTPELFSIACGAKQQPN